MSFLPTDHKDSRFPFRSSVGEGVVLFPVLLVFLLLSIRPAPAQSQVDAGMPLIRNFTPDDYGAHAQNWAIVEDSRGVIYFGNSQGILEYDGKNWSVYPNLNGSLIRSLGLDSRGTIYYGGSGEFGYLGVDARGKLQAVSLVDKLMPADKSFNDVWKTFPTPDGVYFLTNEKTYRFHDGRVDVIPVPLAAQFGFLIDGIVFIVLSERGLAVIRGNDIIPLPQTGDVNNVKFGRIHGVSFSGRRILLSTSRGKLFVYDLAGFFDPAAGKYDFTRKPVNPLPPTPFPCEVEKHLDDRNVILEIEKIDEDLFALRAVNAGLFLIDRRGRIVQKINKQTGLQDDFVRAVMLDRQGNLWLPLNNGLSYVEFDSPVSHFNAALNNLPPYVMTAIRYENRLYVGSFGGVHALAESPGFPEVKGPSFVPVENCTSECAELKVINGMLLAATNSGIFLIRDLRGTLICTQTGIYCIGKSARFPRHLFLGLQDGLAVLEVEPSGGNLKSIPKTVFLGKCPGITDTIRMISEDRDGNLWLSAQFKGLLHLRFSGSDPFHYEMTHYLPEHGLPQIDGNYAIVFQNRLLVGTRKGLFEGIYPEGKKMDPAALRFGPEGSFGRAFAGQTITVYNFLDDRDGNILVNTDQGIFGFSKLEDGSYRTIRDPFRKIPATNVNIISDDRGIIWIPHRKGLFRYDPAVKKRYDRPFNALIRKVTVKNSSVLFNGAYFNPDIRQGLLSTAVSLVQPADMIPVLPYESNALTFDYSSPYFSQSTALQFKHILENFEKTWTDWSNESRTEYTNLPEGSYAFRVKARNVYEQESGEAIFRFTIKPPWHRTWAAFLGYVLIGFGAVVAIVNVYALKLKREKLRLEKIVAERTEEIARKSEELKEASLTDPLTGLRNRRFISEILSSEIDALTSYKMHLLQGGQERRSNNRKQVYGVIALDIDHFKKVNDIYGHKAGDQILKDFARILKSSVRRDDVTLRLGGEEFLVVLKNVDAGYIEIYARKIKNQVAGTDFRIGQDLIIRQTCSIGIVAYPFYPDSPDKLTFEQTMMLADLGLYYAKTHGRNRFAMLVPSETMPSDPEQLQKMASSLEFALENEFVSIRSEDKTG